MSFISPIWLFSIAAISVPVIIHLWNIRPAKTLKVGSIVLMETSSRKRSRSFNLLQLLLLLLRCLLLILVAVVLAMPYFKSKAITGKSKGWLLIPKKDFGEAYQYYQPKADSLIKAGYELHYFNPGFQKTNIAQALADTENYQTTTDYWSLSQQLNGQLPAAVPIYIITPNSLKNFAGNKPGTALKLHWLTYTAKDSTANWIQKAWFTENKDVHVITGNSKSSGTIYHSENIKQSALENSPYTQTVSNGKAFISLKNNAQKPVEIVTAALKIDIFAGANTADANYIKAALESVSQFTQLNMVVGAYNSATSTKKDWLFWLADKPLDNATLGRYNHILVYEPGKTETVNSRVITGDASSQAIPLYRSIISKNYPGETKWTDAYRTPLLSNELTGATQILHFYSRFNPGWNDLVWDAGFPKIILQLIMPDDDHRGTTFDKRIISDKQIQPALISEGVITEDSNISTTDITHYFWLFLVLIFIMERWLAHKNQLER